MTTLTVKPKNKKELAQAKKMLKILDINFEKEDDTPYNPEFVEKILQGEQDFKNGNYTTMTLDQLKALWK